MHIHILGICGTFMAGVALLARAAGHTVSGCDANVYPPMSTQLAAAGITLTEGFDPAQLDPAPDCVVVGNVMSRGKPIIEALLDRGLPYTSGPQWLAEHILRERWVLAVAGTHGKTTTSSMLAWILEHAGMAPGFLIGGVPANFGVSARLGTTPFFVVEADEYDTAFFDKRSKFLHYRPRTAVLNNLEFDHADIFPDLEAIQRQFHHLVRTVPGAGRLVSHAGSAALEATLAQGCWTPVERFDGAQADWQAVAVAPDGSAFDVCLRGERLGRVAWALLGQHNVANALAAIAAARHVGVAPAHAIAALAAFRGVARRLELRGEAAGVRVYDDFAHHPTAIASTLAGLRANLPADRRIVAVLEPRSNTMKLGVFKDTLAPALAAADHVVCYGAPDLGWDLAAAVAPLGARAAVCGTLDATVAAAVAATRAGDAVLVMSNGGFGGIHGRLLEALRDAR
ncbi:UDP-N-acetylmuramate: L-alanyl-gamma-D-glutamyl-meso-diaminopimelate ligase [Plasticicumulans lactativorans]|uniref:UDP-N-acetylmuramate--L-alanyl-gamma-D-glutamyl-meso-2,6-diaminoheptandioate ligase n=1 Tax=Plasticicumulans lactativorans TaxID=1133106 RepID=A0A4V2SCC6_9GAMM|nr:UDP-N-acetylmuramate:L-alanyl-gamma-D-glutamyl-meso-diaminopimelate ligase [Plasticicumulans lactativorans]TCO78870.1 UDP-N-acetylmuramate: L-alanyl-gamma-D-glutamyl-meso-diaminopimelate ligase [Plasticicumulans lactativorans]